MTATLPSATDLRDCRLYRFWVEHPVTGEEVLGYVGETVRQPFERMMEHVDLQPWIDTVTRWERDRRVFAGKGAVLKAEAQAIRSEKPLYNVKGNERNRHRIIPADAIRQRRARDASRNKASWVHPDDRTSDGVRQSAPIVPERRVWVPRTWSAVQRWICLSCVAWATSSTIVWAVLTRNDWPQSTTRRGLSAAIVCLTALLLARWLTPRRRRRLAKAWRWFWRWFR